MSVIYDIYDSNLWPNTKNREDKKYKEMSKEYDRFYEKFIEKLTEEQRKDLEELINLNNLVTYLEQQFCYALGFKTGLKMGLECGE